MRTAIYLRVSTAQQTVENQQKQLETLVNSRNWSIFQVYKDEGISGDSKDRPAFNQMINDAKCGKFDCILVFQLSRLGRSLNQIVQTITELDQANVGVYSMSEHISTMEDNPYGKVTLAIFAALAEVELGLIRERVRAGVKRAQDNGTVFGRPFKGFDLNKALAMKEEGMSIRKIAKALSVSHMTVRRRFEELSQKSPEELASILAHNPSQKPITQTEDKVTEEETKND